jgi:uncharacterized membrane protein YfcA
MTDGNILMGLPTILMLFAAGTAGGVLSGLIGGASLVTFPALLAAGLPPINAAVTNLFALVPANVTTAFTERSQLPRVDRALVGLIVMSSLAAFVGAALLLLTPARTFEFLVPLLLGFATLLLAFSSRITDWMRARALARGSGEPHLGMANIPMLPVSVYGGYFGAGVGVLVLGILMVVTRGDYRPANATKNVLVALNTVAAAALFISRDAVIWQPTLVMMAGAAFGGLLAGQLARVVPSEWMRAAIVAFGALLTATFAWRYWF